MPVLEILLTSVSVAIAKSILKIWIADDPNAELPAGLAGEIVDLLKAVMPDFLTAKKSARELENIGDKAAKSLEFVFKIEGRLLAEPEQEEVAGLVADCLNPEAITAELLADRDLNPKLLAGHLEEQAGETLAGLPPARRELFRRVISEASQSILDIAGKLPNFSERTFAEILKRDRVLVEKADEILDNVQRLREEVRGDQSADAARFETEYRRSVARNLNRMELFGVDLSRASRAHPLNVAYVSLDVSSKNADSADNDADDLDYGEDSIIQDINSTLAKNKRLLIRGQAGCGKTTLLKWIAVQAASHNFEGPLADWNRAIPFLIRLRDFRGGKFPQPGEFSGASAELIAETMPNGWVHDKLRSGEAVIMIDGVDEVADQHRQRVRDWVRELTGAFPEARIIVTSRPHAVEDPNDDSGWLQAEGFPEADLQPMSIRHIANFVEHWHQAVAKELKREEEEPELLELAEALTATIRGNSALRRLATNPLLCGVICALHRDTRRQLPDDRIQLYEQCCFMLLERRDRERQIEVDYPKFSYRQKRALLEDLAYYMLRNDWSVVTEKQARARLSLKLGAMQNLPNDASAEKALRFFVERSGMLRQPSAGKLDFAHRTFQEFLAAQAAVDEGDFGELRKNATNTQWREVIILAAGLARPKERNGLLTNLIEDGDSHEEQGPSLHLLSAACQQTAVDLAPSIAYEIQERLKTYLPPAGVRDAERLADAAGGALIPFLKYSGNLNGNQAKACVRAFARIGSPEALAGMSGYVQDRRKVVRRELFRALGTFDPGEYVRILRLHEVTSLDLNFTAVSDLSPLADFSQLHSLELRDTAISDLTLLAGLSQLQSLDLDGTAVSDLTPLASLSRLQSLDLRGTTVSDLTPLASLSQLQSLHLQRTKVSDLTPLAGLSQLQSLDLDGTAVSDLTPLASLSQLQWLRLRRTKVSEEQLANLRRSLPKLTISS